MERIYEVEVVQFYNFEKKKANVQFFVREMEMKEDEIEKVEGDTQIIWVSPVGHAGRMQSFRRILCKVKAPSMEGAIRRAMQALLEKELEL